jgi:hypothetical protein
MVGRRLRFDDDCMRLNWGSELMMIRIRIACKSRGLVLNLCLTLKVMIRLITNYETVYSSNG